MKSISKTIIFRRQLSELVGEEHDDDYTPEEWAAWDAAAYDSREYGGASEEFAEHFDEHVDDEYYSDDY
ncbi:hypothetical protein CYMTET_12295 [Cymbomonas tetramitiformis]|uniref:Uncharacterized protein n=1 Tax=Cymbomonas tetramitiformis TaxID=36881 RepID=A0AAE0LC78_9CHLO|nr:hypothetical protein CYMTET_12295 [Cymbomonas tetramitiformis]